MIDVMEAGLYLSGASFGILRYTDICLSNSFNHIHLHAQLFHLDTDTIHHAYCRFSQQLERHQLIMALFIENSSVRNIYTFIGAK